jgi:hypothetical protein
MSIIDIIVFGLLAIGVILMIIAILEVLLSRP